MNNEPTLLTRVKAILSVSPGHMEDHYRELRLMAWNEEANDSLEVMAVFQPHDEEVPLTLKVGHHFYRQGQWSGPSGRLVWFDQEQ